MYCIMQCVVEGLTAQAAAEKRTYERVRPLLQYDVQSLRG